MSKPLSLFQIMERFPTEEAAAQWFSEIRWPNGPECPHCESTNVAAVKSGKPMPFRCRDCRKHFSVRTGSVMAESKIPLRKWVAAIYMFSTAKKGIPSTQLARELGITQECAWHLGHRIRKAWEADGGMFSGAVEVDETYVGGKESNKHASKKLHAGRGAVGKVAVAGIRERETGAVKAKVMEGVSKPHLQGFIRDNVNKGSSVYTDDFRAYRGMAEYEHQAVAHSRGEYCSGNAHTNGIESFWALMKRGHYGIYHYWSKKHLHRYVHEFANRNNLSEVTTMQFLASTGVRMIGRRLPYESLANGTA